MSDDDKLTAALHRVEKGQTDEKGRPMAYWGGDVEIPATIGEPR